MRIWCVSKTSSFLPQDETRHQTLPGGKGEKEGRSKGHQQGGTDARSNGSRTQRGNTGCLELNRAQSRNDGTGPRPVRSWGLTPSSPLGLCHLEGIPPPFPCPLIIPPFLGQNHRRFTLAYMYSYISSRNRWPLTRKGPGRWHPELPASFGQDCWGWGGVGSLLLPEECCCARARSAH